MPDETAEISSSLKQMSEADEVVPLRSATMHALNLIGVKAAYFLAPLTADPRIGRMLTNIGLPRTWERQYRARLHRVDPLPGLSLKHSGAFRWPEDVELEKLTDRQRRYLDIAGQYGLLRGLGAACYGPHGRSGFLGGAWLDRQAPDNITLQRFQAIGQASFRRYCQLVDGERNIPALSNRELDVMSWMCAGKSNGVIAQLLGISRSTVDVYVRRIFQKLSVSDRTAACLKGYSLGLTVTPEYQQLMREQVQRNPDTEITR